MRRLCGPDLKPFTEELKYSKLLAKRQVLQSEIDSLFESGKDGREQLL
jgi:hypothetical protein